MKKFASTLLCLALLLSLIPATGLTASAAGVTEISANQTYTINWDDSTEQKYIYLTVDETGFYDAYVEDLKYTAELVVSMYDMDIDSSSDNLYNAGMFCYIYEWEPEPYTEMLYLTAGHVYQLECEYYTYYDECEYQDASMRISFTKSNYTPIALTVNNYKRIVVGDRTDWMEFTTTQGGDYLMELSDYAGMAIYLYDKATGEPVNAPYMSFDEDLSFRVHLEANKTYIAVAYTYEESAHYLHFAVNKAESDITYVGYNYSYDSILPHHLFVDDGYSVLDYNACSEAYYIVTFSDGETMSYSYDEWAHYYGIHISDIHYAGECFYDENGYAYMAGGAQPVYIEVNGQLYPSTVYITSYVEWCSDLNPMESYDEMEITYEDDGYYCYYWRLTPQETNMYDFYSYDWDSIDSTLTVFDENNRVVECTDEGWNLKKGKEYVLRIEYYYNEYYYNDVIFWLEPCRDHTHSYIAATCTAPKTCRVCGATSGKSLGGHQWKNGVCTTCGKKSDSVVSITAEPKTGYAPMGDKVSVKVTAKGEGLRYEWYIKNDGAKKYSKSSVTSATYTATMNEKTKDRLVFCRVYDKYGNMVQTKTVRLREAVSITKQPASAAVYAQTGKKATIKINASGDGLTYTWYIKNDGASKYSKSSVTSSTYSATMGSKVKGRRVYCVVTDKYGKTVQTKTFVLRESVSITTQPKTVTVKKNATAKVTVKASGDGLKYTWYIKNAGASKYTKSSVTGATYSTKMTNSAKNRWVYCVVTDKYGKTVKSTAVQLKMK